MTVLQEARAAQAGMSEELPDDSDAWTAEEASTAIRESEQCLLMANIEMYARANDRAHYQFFSLIDDDISPSLIISNLANKSNAARIFNITPAQLAALQPKFRLYKCVYEDEKIGGRDIELAFEDYTDPANIKNITSSKAGRGGGVGLKSFSWKFLGVNPFESDKAITAQMELHFNTLEEVIREQQSGAVSFLDIMFPTRRGPDTAPFRIQKHPRYARIKAVVGWSAPVDNQFLFSQELKDTIEELNMTLFLTYVGHTFKFNQDGTVNLKIEFIAAVDAMMTYIDTDIFSSHVLFDEESTHNQLQLEINEIEKYLESVRETRSDIERRNSRGCDTLVNREGVALSEDVTRRVLDSLAGSTSDQTRINERLEELRTSQQSQRYDRFIIYLLDNSQIKRQYLRRPPGSLARLVYNQPAGSFYAESVYDTNNLGIDDTNLNYNDTFLIRNSTGLATDADVDISDIVPFGGRYESGGEFRYYFDFVYFGDLLEAAFGLVFNENNLNPIDRNDLNQMRMLLGPVAFPDPITNHKINLADIPISLELFMTWFLEEVVNKQRQKLTLKTFIKQVMMKVLASAFVTRCFELENENNEIPKVSSLLFSAPAGRDLLSNVEPGDMVTDSDLSAIQDLLMGSQVDGSEVSDLLHYLIIFQSNHPDRSLTGDADQDFARGIYHFNIGSDTGILKDITFKRTEKSFLREARLEQEGALGYGFLREKYDARVSLFGSSLFLPGMYIYLNPSFGGLTDPSMPFTIANEIGLGGYYLIETVDSRIMRGKFETDLQVIWQQSGVTPGNTCPPPLSISNLTDARNTILQKIEDIEAQEEQGTRARERHAQISRDPIPAYRSGGRGPQL